jgi:hypothetical protein
VKFFGFNRIVDGDQWLRRTGIHHDENGIGRSPEKLRRMVRSLILTDDFQHAATMNRLVS